MKYLKYILIGISIIIIFTTTLIIFNIHGKIKINEITINEEINEDLTKTIKVKIHNPYKKKVKCAISEKEEPNKETSWINSKDNSCEFNIHSGNYYILLKDENNNIIKSKSNEVKINKILDLKLNTDKIYLTLGETYEIKAEITSIGENDETLEFTSSDENIITINNNIITPINNGTATITVKTTNNITKEINVTVTDLYKKASLENNKIKLQCNLYSSEEAKMLDEILEFKINEAGYKTRGAVVATARFLILEFPYQIPYFYENGRLNNHEGRPRADGEGRFYKKGLYLHEDKFSILTVKSKNEPATWGCPLMNYQNEHGYISGRKYPNGLDCSGFVSWALLNAGFDVGDSGAGDTERTDDIGDLGIKHPLTKDFVYNGSYKVGDLIGRDGHIAIIAGLDDNNIYISESLVGGVVIKSFPKAGPKLYQLYSFINTMDEIYLDEGKYTNMW